MTPDRFELRFAFPVLLSTSTNLCRSALALCTGDISMVSLPWTCRPGGRPVDPRCPEQLRETVPFNRWGRRLPPELIPYPQTAGQRPHATDKARAHETFIQVPEVCDPQRTLASR